MARHELSQGPLITELYAIYCEAFSVVPLGGQLAFQWAKSMWPRAWPRCSGRAWAPARTAAPRSEARQFTKFVRDHLDPDWRTREPYGPPR